ncbi:hypothetical protein [Campylobacter lari]|uniref:hypothetical protein n=1 Tax=Campylobacter lari TaxID=201 RepID=UPI0021C102E6|nr:hypothetical protein [Campylobacter lari]
MIGLDLYYSIESKLPRKYHWFTNWYIKFEKPKISNEELKLKFEKLNNTQLNEVAFNLSNTKILNPTKVFWLYNFIFGALGVARFAIGHFKIGLFRLIFTIIAIVVSFFLNMNSYDPLIGLLYIFFYYGGHGLWIADLFMVGVSLRNQNIEKINNILDEILAKDNV